MKRFDYDEENDDDNEDDEKFYDDQPQPISHNDYKDLIEGDQAIQHETVALGYLELDQRLLNKAIKICEGSVLWNFYSMQTRLSMISKAYTRLKKMIDA